VGKVEHPLLVIGEGWIKLAIADALAVDVKLVQAKPGN